MDNIPVSPRISQSDLKLLRSGYLADIEIICGDRKWGAHKAILGSRSHWFKKAMSGGSEGSTDEIRIEDQDSDLVDCVLAFIYTGDIARTVKHAANIMDISACKACVLLWTMGDFFQLQLLATQSIEALQNTYPSICILPCKDGVVAAYIDHPQAKPCQNALVTLFSNAGPSWTQGTDIRQLVDEVPAFGADMFKASLDKAETAQARAAYRSPTGTGDAGPWGCDKAKGWGNWASNGGGGGGGWGTGNSGADDWGQGDRSDAESLWG